ncbi:MAG: FAD-dependent oxidoreductase, partial [Desulfobulbaceae bacterium]|nr:FAD-dependent oxidoreductase [Desulfobulbaceae bacterium]
LRYLQHFNIKRMRHSITARREMMQLAPHLVEPLACMMPLSGKGLRSKGVMRAALFVNDCIGWDRNRGLPAEIRLPGGRIVSKEHCLEVVPGLSSEGLAGASVWYDALALNTERLVLEYILKSLDHGARAANYAEVTGVEQGENDLYRVRVRDNLSREEHQLQTRYIVNASGPWFEDLFCPPSGKHNDRKIKGKKQRWALALNIVSRKKIFTDYAVALEGQSRYEDKDAIIRRGKRLYFFVPWRGCTMIGTEYEESVSGGPDRLQVKRETIQNMVDEVNAIYPPAALSYEDISFYHAGLLPMRSGVESGDIQLEKNSTFHEHGDINFSRVLSVKGVKYTTAPHVAREIVKYFTKRDSGKRMRTPVCSAPAPGTWRNDQSQVHKMLQGRYGQRAVHILVRMQEEQERAIWLDEAARLLKAEVRYLIDEEMVCTLADLVFRRTGLGTAANPGRKLLTKLSVFMGDILNWDEARKAREVETVLQRYAPLEPKKDEVKSE